MRILFAYTALSVKEIRFCSLQQWSKPSSRSGTKLSSLLVVKAATTLASEEIFLLPISHVVLLVYENVEVVGGRRCKYKNHDASDFADAQKSGPSDLPFIVCFKHGNVLISDATSVMNAYDHLLYKDDGTIEGEVKRKLNPAEEN
ncbi:hypothetical protein V6N13_037649 [Hibiscus sabdariffa]|uniref:Uncharacterized protein n=1 Tax=Hibiscus sabdariffa TaxID=183260 RepID=A0ABR2S5B0_9ROSI